MTNLRKKIVCINGQNMFLIVSNLGYDGKKAVYFQSYDENNADLPVPESVSCTFQMQKDFYFPLAPLSVDGEPRKCFEVNSEFSFWIFDGERELCAIKKGRVVFSK